MLNIITTKAAIFIVFIYRKCFYGDKKILYVCLIYYIQIKFYHITIKKGLINQVFFFKGKFIHLFNCINQNKIHVINY